MGYNLFLLDQSYKKLNHENKRVLLNKWPHRIPREHVSLLEVGKSQFHCSKESTLKLPPFYSPLVPKNMLSTTFRFWLKTCPPPDWFQTYGRFHIQATGMKYGNIKKSFPDFVNHLITRPNPNLLWLGEMSVSRKSQIIEGSIITV